MLLESLRGLRQVNVEAGALGVLVIKICVTWYLILIILIRSSTEWSGIYIYVVLSVAVVLGNVQFARSINLPRT